MNEYITSIEALLLAKKENNKKEPTRAEKMEFQISWTSLVKEYGYAGKAEQFLYDGFSFCGAEPFYLFLKQTSDKNDVLKQMFDGKHYGKDCNVTFRLITHLFALMLNDEAPSNLLAPIIKHFPAACRNKEGKRLGTAVKTLEKYLLNVLSPTVELKPLAEMNLDLGMSNSFMGVFSSLIGELKQNDSLKELAVSNIAKIEKWARDYLETTGAVDTHSGSVQTDIQESSNAVLGEQSVEDEGNPDFSNHEKETTVDLDSLQELLIHAQAMVDLISKENVEQKQRIRELETKDQDHSLRFAEASKKLETQETLISELNKKKDELENQYLALQHKLDEKENLLKEKDAEIAERIKMTEVLSRDRLRQADESLQRIASKIKVEYRDFMDAMDIPMTVDLGENLRLQLMSIFKILEKGGIKIE